MSLLVSNKLTYPMIETTALRFPLTTVQAAIPFNIISTHPT